MKWVKNEEQFRIPIKSWCASIEEGTLRQAMNLACHPVLECHVALMPDCHIGNGMPIGGVIAADNAILPSAVGVDIGCGMVAVQTNIPAEQLSDMRERRAVPSPVRLSALKNAMPQWRELSLSDGENTEALTKGTRGFLTSRRCLRHTSPLTMSLR
ncbi:MAG: RtcB family protein [Victivallales bacterium]|nr:RtcB family protein [Victivallales bacterium]